MVVTDFFLGLVRARRSTIGYNTIFSDQSKISVSRVSSIATSCLADVLGQSTPVRTVLTVTPLMVSPKDISMATSTNVTIHATPQRTSTGSTQDALTAKEVLDGSTTPEDVHSHPALTAYSATGPHTKNITIVAFVTSLRRTVHGKASSCLSITDEQIFSIQQRKEEVGYR